MLTSKFSPALELKDNGKISKHSIKKARGNQALLKKKLFLISLINNTKNILNNINFLIIFYIY